MSDATWQKQFRQAEKDIQTTLRVYTVVAQAIFFVVFTSFLFGAWNVSKMIAAVLVGGTLLASVLYIVHTLLILLLSTLFTGITSGLSKVKDITVAGVSSVVNILLADWTITLGVLISVGTSILITKYIYDNVTMPAFVMPEFSLFSKKEEVKPEEKPKEE
jgi:hypothetical protein